MNQETFISMLWILIAVTCIELSTIANAQSRKTSATSSMREDANNNTEPDHPSEYTYTHTYIYIYTCITVFEIIFRPRSLRSRKISFPSRFLAHGENNIRKGKLLKNAASLLFFFVSHARDFHERGLISFEYGFRFASSNFLRNSCNPFVEFWQITVHHEDGTAYPFILK